ncbi:MAG: hypothetical protein FWC79_03805 [Oscillospiraceae bacterium]|nr:hypothetical protein [Oscillospiraceae bacterium]
MRTVNVVTLEKLNGYQYQGEKVTVRFIPWLEGSGHYKVWDATIYRTGCKDSLHCEIYTKKLSHDVMTQIATFFVEAERTVDETKKFLKSLLWWKTSHVYKRDREGKVIETSKKAPEIPYLQYPGTRLDEIAD